MLLKSKLKSPRKPLIPKVEGNNLLPISLVVLASTTTVLAVAFLWIALQTSRIANRKEPTLVQSSYGESFVAIAQDYNYRDPNLLQNTAKEWAMLTFSWGAPASTVAGSEDLVDFEKYKIPLSVYKASMLLSDSFRDSFLRTYAEEVFTDEAVRGDISSLYVPLQVLPPVEVEPGRWQVEVLGSRYISTMRNPTGTMKPANFQIELLASDIPISPLGEDASPAVQAVYRLFESGLRITDIKEVPSNASR